MKIDSDHITHSYENNVQFSQCLEWRNFSIQDSTYVSQFLKLKDRMSRELKEKRCKLFLIDIDIELTTLEKSLYLNQIQAFLQNILEIKNELVMEKEAKIKEKHHHIMILKDKILKKEMEDTEFKNKLQSKEKSNLKNNKKYS